jgi:hypothetical protein
MLEDAFVFRTINHSGPTAWLRWHPNLKALEQSSAHCDICETSMQALQEDLLSQVDELILSGDMPQGDRKIYYNGLMTVQKYQAYRFEIRLRYLYGEMQDQSAQAHMEIILQPKDSRYASWEPGDLSATFRILASHRMLHVPLNAKFLHS